MNIIKKTLPLLLFIGMLSACDKDTGLAGTWKLIELLSDPGDGSGTFQSVDSDRVIQFNADGTLSSNGDLCFMGISSDTPSMGTYSIADGSIIVDSCTNSPIFFSTENNLLMLTYLCIEPCQAKYQKQ